MTTPITIDASAFYTDGLVRIKLGISHAALARGRKAGQLRYTRRAGRTMYRGDWLIAWLTGDEVLEEQAVEAC